MPDIAIQINQNFDGINIDAAKLKELTRAVCRRFAANKTKDAKYEISIAVVDNAQIRGLNKQFCKQSRSTDCLSFDLSDSEANSPKVFELVINAERATKEAKLRGHSAQAELALYITHALLHNLGFDDSTRAKAKKMHDTEDEILQQFGFGLIYNSSSS
jgi:rRNA maturation RNase YbeY